jgi:hypothetical protein
MRIGYIVIALLAIVACKKEKSTPSINKELIYGWWYHDQLRSDMTDYKGRSFNRDGTMTIDGSNFGAPGNSNGGNWTWSGDTILFAGATTRFYVTRLDKDSLYVDRHDHPNPVYKLYYGR